MENIVQRIKQFENNPTDIDINRLIDKRIHKENLLRELPYIVDEIIRDIENSRLIQNKSRYIIVDNYIYPEKYLPIQKEVCNKLTIKMQKAGLFKAFIEIVNGVIVIHPNF